MKFNSKLLSLTLVAAITLPAWAQEPISQVNAEEAKTELSTEEVVMAGALEKLEKLSNGNKVELSAEELEAIVTIMLLASKIEQKKEAIAAETGFVNFVLSSACFAAIGWTAANFEDRRHNRAMTKVREENGRDADSFLDNPEYKRIKSLHVSRQGWIIMGTVAVWALTNVGLMVRQEMARSKKESKKSKPETKSEPVSA